MNRRIGDNVSQLFERLRPKAKSLIITVYGDAILHHGGSAWLGSVINLVDSLGLNERIVRTSVFRLSKEDWLASSQIGRRSYYRLTDQGRRRFEAANSRIYFHVNQPWDGRWTLVITNTAELDAERRDLLRRNLGWIGFGQLANGVMLHPAPDTGVMRQVIADIGVTEQAVVMTGGLEAGFPTNALETMIQGCWDLKRLAEDYDEFLDMFRPLWQALSGNGDLDPEQCFVVRTLLMHGYRRALLRDPMLPDELLPANWPGTAARALCRNLYRLVQAAAETHVMSLLETAEGPVPEAQPSYYTRFGGLRSDDSM
ncbi:phenylacetic acid degradation operon negative regulatory protein PaaX [Paramagnetospirillum kuznetsovii]|uniref:Phenylacetic acid degradation operon negative regulatory protein PaaX n=1 Tax=Paramagnetospirillum kuznetsovii TaxID=2053833 RepID=A0A364NW11_9PROT|nr:phenylacetic acid degradation operon negative regulatory protein PaaX [Paramagnetospirillum kuznetsovii]RAU21180.1 phenylacetic acid degradation operon negative regulatory protein PaaX [Paramagnetospirillum kuznetsovii]